MYAVYGFRDFTFFILFSSSSHFPNSSHLITLDAPLTATTHSFLLFCSFFASYFPFLLSLHNFLHFIFNFFSFYCSQIFSFSLPGLAIPPQQLIIEFIYCGSPPLQPASSALPPYSNQSHSQHTLHPIPGRGV